MRSRLSRHAPLVSLALSAAALIAVLGTSSAAAAAANFLLNVTNTSTATTTLKGSAVAGKALQVTNTNTTAGSAALGLTVAAGHAPLTVNASAGKATNLNADELDGLDSTQLQRPLVGDCAAGTSLIGFSQAGATTCATFPHTENVSNGYGTGPFPAAADLGQFTLGATSTIAISFSASAWSTAGGKLISLELVACSALPCQTSNELGLAIARGYTNEPASHRTLVSGYTVGIIGEGTWYLNVIPIGSTTTTDGNDTASWMILSL